MSETYALLINGVVTNLIYADQQFLDFTAGTSLYDEAIPIDAIRPTPAMGWLYENGTFTNPDELNTQGA